MLTASILLQPLNPAINLHGTWLNLREIWRMHDAKDHIRKPQDPWLEVEDVMAATLEKNHIDLPDSFFTVNSGFQPKFPPK